MKNLYLTLLAFLFSFSSFAQVGAINGTLAVCDTTSVTLSDTSAGGTWTSSNTFVGVVGSSSGIVTGYNFGTTTITYTTSSGYATAVVTFNHLPAPIMGITPLCAGTVAILTDITGGGTWSTSSTAVAAVSSAGVAVGIAAGAAIVTYTLPTGCITTSGLFVNPSPAPISGMLSVCLGTTTILSDIVAGGTWVSSSPAVAVVSGMGMVTGISLGTASISYTLPSGCFTSASVIVISAGPPITGGTLVCTGSTLGLSDSTLGGTWASSNPAVAIVGSSSGIVSGNTPGTALITYTTISGCRATTSVAVVTCTCSGTPAGGLATAPSGAICYGSSTTLGLSGATISTAVVYQWQTSADGATWTDLAGATTSSYLYTPLVSQYYRCSLTCSSSGLSAFSGSLYISVPVGTILAHNVVPMPDTVCNIANFYISTCGTSSTYHVVTYYGDGTTSDSAFIVGAGNSHANVYHTYAAAGTYTVKQVLFYGATAVDSASFSYEFLPCSILPVKFYFDANSNCVFDAGDAYNTMPQTVAVDSNGITIDTFSITSGIYYRAYGPAGTVYGFSLLPVPGGLLVSCPASGIVYDTVGATGTTFASQYIALACASGTPVFDLSVSATQTCGRHREQIYVTVTNTYCYAVAPVVTIAHSPKYDMLSGDTYPTPSSDAGNIVTWNLPLLAAGSSTMISMHRERTSGWLTPGDTIMTKVSVGPMTGDLDAANNVIIRCDTVNAAYDPNNISVVPDNYILPCTRLQYQVMFENTGNDTAHNVYVLDTLSDDLDPHSLQVIAASAAMNISMLTYGAHNVAKFDFPNINLLDTTHHLSNGMLIFNISAKNSVVDGAAIRNQVGIYFDDNPVVMTNTVKNTVGIAPISGLPNICVGVPDTLINATTGGLWTRSNTNATVAAGVVTGVTTGLDTISYTVANSCASRTAIKVVTVDATPVTGPIGGIAVVCAGSSTTLTDVYPGGAWTSGATGIATVATGSVTGIAPGTATITYTATNICGTDMATTVVTVSPLSVAGSISGPALVCTGSVTALSSSVTGGSWSTGGAGIASVNSAGEVNGISAGTVTISYAVANSCGVAYAIQMETVSATVVPAVGINSFPGDTVCAGSALTVIATPTNGGVSPFYQWKVNSTDVTTGITYGYVPVDGDIVTVVMASHAECASPDTVIHTVTISVEAPLIPVVTISASPGFAISAGEVDTLTATATSAGTAPSYQWIVNGTTIPGATNNVYYSTFSNHDSVSCRVVSNGLCAGYMSYNSVHITVGSTGVAMVNSGEQLTLYPNPTSNELNIAWKNYATGNADVVITDVAGREVYKSTISITNGFGYVHLDLPSMTDGIYIVTVRSNSGTVHKQLEIKK